MCRTGTRSAMEPAMALTALSSPTPKVCGRTSRVCEQAVSRVVILGNEAHGDQHTQALGDALCIGGPQSVSQDELSLDFWSIGTKTHSITFEARGHQKKAAARSAQVKRRSRLATTAAHPSERHHGLSSALTAGHKQNTAPPAA